MYWFVALSILVFGFFVGGTALSFREGMVGEGIFGLALAIFWLVIAFLVQNQASKNVVAAYEAARQQNIRIRIDIWRNRCYALGAGLAEVELDLRPQPAGFTNQSEALWIKNAKSGVVATRTSLSNHITL